MAEGPDCYGILVAEKYVTKATVESIPFLNLGDKQIFLAASIALQTEYYNWLVDSPKSPRFWIDCPDDSGLGYAQISNIQKQFLGFNHLDQGEPESAVFLMRIRLERVFTALRIYYPGSDPYDYVIAAALGNNNNFVIDNDSNEDPAGGLLPGTRTILRYTKTKKPNWRYYFGEPFSASDRLARGRADAVGLKYNALNTIVFIYDLVELAKRDWTLPEGVTIEGLQKLQKDVKLWSLGK